jgi:hypothetical protein
MPRSRRVIQARHPAKFVGRACLDWGFREDGVFEFTINLGEFKSSRNVLVDRKINNMSYLCFKVKLFMPFLVLASLTAFTLALWFSSSLIIVYSYVGGLSTSDNTRLDHSRGRANRFFPHINNTIKVDRQPQPRVQRLARSIPAAAAAGAGGGAFTEDITSIYLPTNSSETCRSHARKYAPFDDVYLWRRDQPLPQFHDNNNNNASICTWPLDRPMSNHTFASATQETMFDWAGPHSRRFNATIRYKIYKGILYYDGDYQLDRMAPYGDNPIATYGPVFEELVLLAMHMYPSLPDMDLIVDLGDSPSPTTTVPTLSLAVFDDATKRTGCAVPYNAWETVGGSVAQLQHWMGCLDMRYPVAEKRHQVIFRGGTTGEIRMHPDLESTPKEWSELWRHPERPPSHWKSLVLYNPRILAAVMTRHLPWMDVGITGFHWEWHSPLGREAGTYWWSPAKVLEDTFNVTVPFMEEEEISGYAGNLVIESHGFQQRLPAALISGSVVLLQDRPERDWFQHALKDGEHYEAFRHDMADMAMKSFQVAEDYKNGGERKWEEMVAAARAFSLEHFTAQAMVVATTYSLLHYRQYYAPYQPDPPDTSQFLRVNHKKWVNGFISEDVRKQVEGWNPENHPGKKNPTLRPFRIKYVHTTSAS